ncbi:MAG: archaeosine tRNA-ribosyltransferase type 5 [Gemmatimonadales bacterium]|nr:archaeosine tRNA-ribosyltransferase type 5 [Gemmatimonadales bacterium]
MKFFFPDSQDQIDPTFDFVTEERSPLRVRQRDELYAHEALTKAPFNGYLVSKAIVDGVPGASGKYTLAQRHRLYRVGVHRFFRLEDVQGPPLQTLGDCGGFSYINEDVPPYTPDQVIDFYDECGFDLGISVDHVILGYDPSADLDSSHPKRENWTKRQKITLELAAEFLDRCNVRQARLEPLGAAQGWSPHSYAVSVRELQKIGYKRIALGGMVPLKTDEILACLREIETVREKDTQLHLLGITRYNNVPEFATYGVTSFDSTSAFRQSFKDDRDNYHWLDRNYTAIRVPQVDGNPKLKARIRSGQIDQGQALQREQACLGALRGFDAGEVSTQTVIDALNRYEELFDGRKDYSEIYRETLSNAPWKTCKCGICERAGINVVLFRGSERNKRRGFHNLHILRQRLDRGTEGAQDD